MKRLRNLLFGFESFAPLLFALQSTLAFLQLLELSNIQYSIVFHRLWEVVTFDMGLKLTAPMSILMVLWMAWMIQRKRFSPILFPILSIFFYPVFGLEATLSIATVLAISIGLRTFHKIEKYILWLLTIFGGLEILALLHWMFFIPLGLTSPLSWAARLNIDLYYLGSFFGPYLGLSLCVFCLLTFLRSYLRGFESPLKLDVQIKSDTLSLNLGILLLISLSLGLAASLYPYLPNVNPRDIDAGVDIREYVNATEMVEKDPTHALILMGGSRPLIFLTINAFQKVFGLSTLSAVRFLPILLNPLLVISVFFLAHEMFNDWGIASWSAFFTACGYQITVGIYSYFLANMLGLCLIFSSLAFLLRAIKKRKLIHLFSASSLGALLVFTHPWTFDQYYAPIFLISTIQFYQIITKKINYKDGLFLLVYLSSLSLSELVRILFFRGVEGSTALQTATSSFIGVQAFWSSLELGFNTLYGGLMSNMVLLVLAIVGVAFVLRKNTKGIFLLLLMTTTSLIFLMGDGNIKSRLFYNIPIGILATLGYHYSLDLQILKEIKKTYSGFIILSMIVYLFMSLSILF